MDERNKIIKWRDLSPNTQAAWSDWDVPEKQPPPAASNGWACAHTSIVNVGFNHDKFVCAYCDKEFPNYDPDALKPPVKQ